MSATLSPVRLLRIEDMATFRGVQEGFEHLPAIELWDLKRSIPGHPVGSTVSRNTILRHLSDLAAEERTEGRLLRPARVNPHD